MTNAQLIEILQKLPPDADVYLMQDEFGYHYTFYNVKYKDVGKQMPVEGGYNSQDLGREIMGVVLG